MTRKDYERIAKAIANAKAAAADYRDKFTVENGAFEAARYLALALRDDNPRFERARFMAACGFPASE